MRELRLLLVLVLLVTLSTGDLHGHDDVPGPAPAAPVPAAVPRWGQLEAEELRLFPPDAFLGLAAEYACGATTVAWTFFGRDRAATERLFVDAHVAPALRDELWRALVACDDGPEPACSFQVPVALLARLDDPSRADLHRELGRSPLGLTSVMMLRRRSAEMERWIASLPLSSAVRAELRRLAFTDGPYLTFMDMELLCACMTSPDDRRTISRALNEIRGQRLRLRVPAGAPPEELVRYWGAGGREAEVRWLLGSLAGRGGTIDVADLLPPFARARLYRYPEPDEPPRSCFWSAFNFFADEPDDGWMESAQITARIDEDFAPIERSELRLGDVLLYGAAGGAILHAAAYVADDIVFTKNGVSLLRPYTLMRIADLDELYFGSKVAYLRRRR